MPPILVCFYQPKMETIDHGQRINMAKNCCKPDRHKLQRRPYDSQLETINTSDERCQDAGKKDSLDTHEEITEQPRSSQFLDKQILSCLSTGDMVRSTFECSKSSNLQGVQISSIANCTHRASFDAHAVQFRASGQSHLKTNRFCARGEPYVGIRLCLSGHLLWHPLARFGAYWNMLLAGIPELT